MTIDSEIIKVRSQFIDDLASAENSKDLDNLKVKYLGKKGFLSSLMINLKDCTSEQRPVFGKLINDLKQEIQSKLDESLKLFSQKEQDSKLKEEFIDITLPGRKKNLGRDHPITAMINNIIDILVSMGFSVQLGPDVDSDYYNFEGLNFPKDHPAREMQDTFYISKDMLLRTQTSNVQVRVMEKNKPPIRVIAPGKCFRNENISSRSHVFFHQIEGFYIDKNVKFADLLATLDEFWSKVFQKKIETRYRPSYFPFVEPGLEGDIKCTICSGQGCKLCKHTGWLEVVGAGMIHPEVLKAGEIDPEVYSGYAWGLGIERLVMLKYGIEDIRMFTQNDLRFLQQFN